MSGVLISDVAAARLPAGQAPLTVLKTAQRAKAAAFADPSSAKGSIPLGIVAALALLGMGAVRERRR